MVWDRGEKCVVWEGGWCWREGECGVDAEYTVLVCYTHISVLLHAHSL